MRRTNLGPRLRVEPAVQREKTHSSWKKFAPTGKRKEENEERETWHVPMRQVKLNVAALIAEEQQAAAAVVIDAFRVGSVMQGAR